MKKDLIIGALLLILGIVIGWLCRPDHIREVTKKVTDTLVVVDTHIIEKPVLVERTVKESLLVAVHDTTIINDTIYVPIPIEKKIYKGDDYLAEISGYKASLDRIEVYPKTIKVTETQEKIRKNRISVGMELGYANTLTTPIYLEYDRMLHKNAEVFAKFEYDIYSEIKTIGAGFRLKIEW